MQFYLRRSLLCSFNSMQTPDESLSPIMPMRGIIVLCNNTAELYVALSYWYLSTPKEVQMAFLELFQYSKKQPSFIIIKSNSILYLLLVSSLWNFNILFFPGDLIFINIKSQMSHEKDSTEINGSEGTFGLIRNSETSSRCYLDVLTKYIMFAADQPTSHCYFKLDYLYFKSCKQACDTSS